MKSNECEWLLWGGSGLIERGCSFASTIGNYRLGPAIQTSSDFQFMPWYAIRTVYHFGTKRNGVNVFEERIVCFDAQTWPEAHARAEAESEEYARENGFRAHPEQYGYQQDGTALVDGYELWSELFEANASLKSFYQARYMTFLYTPDEPVQ